MFDAIFREADQSAGFLEQILDALPAPVSQNLVHNDMIGGGGRPIQCLRGLLLSPSEFFVVSDLKSEHQAQQPE